MIDCGVLNWYEKTLNDVLVLVNDIKLNKTSNGTWVTAAASANASTGKQGAKRPPTPTPDNTSNPPSTNTEPLYLTKPADLSFKEVRMLLERYSCPLCRRNSHPLYNCHALTRTYNISLKNASSNDSNTSFTPPPAPTTAPSVTANRVTTSVSLIQDIPSRYDGFESIASPPPDSDTEDTEEDLVEPTESLGIQNNTNNQIGRASCRERV